MLKAKSFLGIDFGAGTVKAAEFARGETTALKLLRFGVKPLGLAGSQDAARDNIVKKALAELLADRGFNAGAVNVCAPGFQVFSKFVKLPPVDTSKVTQIIQYEAQQNVPFPLAETSWDYQILGTSATGELEVLLVAIKSDLVEKLLASGESSGLKMSVVEASVAALANAFRYNYPDVEGCSLLVDIGAKTSNVLLFEKNKFYARSINVGSNAITQEFAAEAKIPFAEAEKIKVNEGFVSLGGAYEEPDNPRLAAISKVARNVLTRLHLQVNQTIQFYRTQQGGSAPTQVFLCGGGSILPYSTQFFHEKLNLPVEYFDPFRNVQIDPGVDVAELEKYAQCFGEVVGLGLRNIAQCPVELNLMPKKFLARQQFNAKKPFLIGAAFALVAGTFAYGYYFTREAQVKQAALDDIKTQLNPLQVKEEGLKREEGSLKALADEEAALAGFLKDKTYWADILTDVRQAMLKTERIAEDKYKRKVGVWIEKLLSTEPTVEVTSTEEDKPRPFFMDPILMKRYGLRMPPGMFPGAATEEGGEGGAKKAEKNTNELANVKVTFRAVDLKSADPNANNALMYDLQRELQASPFFDPKETQLTGNMTPEENPPTFTFDLKLAFKRPFKL